MPDNAPPANLEAANYLADIIETASGKTRPSVIQQPVATAVPAWAIKVGYPYQSDAYEESLIQFERGSPIELTGVDDFDPLNPDYIGAKRTDTNYMKKAGTYHAVMSFIQDHLGVVIAWPGELGTAVAASSEKTVFPESRKHKPSCTVRGHLRFRTPGSSNGHGWEETRSWLKKQRGFYSMQVPLGHEFVGYYDRFHPNGTPGGNREDIFALQSNGTRSGFPFGGYAKLEVGDPALDDVWLDVNVEEVLASNPHRTVFSCAFNDGWNRGHSVDPRALAMDYSGPDANMVALISEGGPWPSPLVPVLTDRELAFTNRCAKKLKAAHPELFTSMAAYGGATAPAPKRETPDDNVIIVNVASDFSDPNWRDGLDRQDFDDWLKVCPRNQVWRPNVGRGHGEFMGMWMPDVHKVGNRLKEIIPKGVIGFVPDTFWEEWCNQWRMYYVISQLLWDHTQDVDEILDKAYTAMFGPAATHIKNYYDAIEAITMANPVHSATYAQTAAIWTNAVMTGLQGHLDLALAATFVDTDERFRVEWVQAGHDWSQAVVDCCRYSLTHDLPVRVTDLTNLALQQNALEADVDSTAGWVPAFGAGALDLTSQSEVTNGSNYAFLMRTLGGISCGIRTTVPGTPSDVYLATIDAKNTGLGGPMIVTAERADAPHQSFTVSHTETDWKTIKFEVRGGDTILIREMIATTRIASGYFDNLRLYAAEAIDPVALRAEWQGVVDAAIAAADDPKWSSLPVALLKARSMLPTPDHPEEPTDPGEGFI